MESHKQAFHIHRQDHQLIAFAGLWEHWEHEAQTLYSCTIITTVATALMQPIHERMPVIMPVDHCRNWLDKSATEHEAFQLLDNRAYADMTTTAISDYVNNPRHDDKKCLN